MLTLFSERKNPNKTPQKGSPSKACDDKAVINLSAKCAQSTDYEPQIRMGSWLQLNIHIFRKKLLDGAKSGILY